MKRLLFSIVLFVSTTMIYAQGENNIWTFGFEANTMIDFNTTPPSVGQMPITTTWNTSHWASAVCRPNGQLRFFARLKQNFFPTTPEYYLFDPSGNPIAGSDLLTDAGALDFSMPVIIPRPGDLDQYYIFHCKDDGLYYSLLDMSVNGGNGGIDPLQKDIPLLPAGSVFTRLVTAVKGCNGTWLVIRSQIANEYYSFHVTASGVDTQKVISECGNFPIADYSFGGALESSSDGTMLATTNWAGVEWYDFEGCSGKLKNARVLDTTGNPPLFPGAAFFLPTHGRFTGVAFSPDNSKLYVTKNKFVNYEVTAGELFQFDVALPSLAAVIASRTLIFTNLPFLTADISGICGSLTIQEPLGEVKAGPDGRIYINNGSEFCLDTAFVPAGYNPCPGFHVLDMPNAAGLACLPDYNRIKVPFGVAFNASGYAVSYLQNNIVYAPSLPDTVYNAPIVLTACFKDSTVLSADSTASCYLWDDGSSGTERMVLLSGIYFVSYYQNCRFTVDTFKVTFQTLPKLEVLSHSCEGKPTGRIVLSKGIGNNENFRAIWKDSSGNIIQEDSGITSSQLSGVGPGNYSVEYISSTGCDTLLSAIVSSYPAITVSTTPSDTTIHYGDSVTLHASGASLYVWWPAGSLDTAVTADPTARPTAPTLYTVIGISDHGCRDTGFVKINLDYTMPDLIPNAFSPNSDGLNDVFRIEGITYQKIKFFKIFNRFGQLVFSTMDGKKGWDGTQNGLPCDGGTYYYFIQLEYPDKAQKTYKGDVLLIR